MTIRRTGCAGAGPGVKENMRTSIHAKGRVCVSVSGFRAEYAGIVNLLAELETRSSRMQRHSLGLSIKHEPERSLFIINKEFEQKLISFAEVRFGRGIGPK